MVDADDIEAILQDFEQFAEVYWDLIPKQDLPNSIPESLKRIHRGMLKRDTESYLELLRCVRNSKWLTLRSWWDARTRQNYKEWLINGPSA